jgi:hypothetical protein
MAGLPRQLDNLVGLERGRLVVGAVLDDAFALTDLAGQGLWDARRGKYIRHLLTSLLRQSVFGRLAGNEDVIGTDRLAHDPVAKLLHWRLPCRQEGRLGRASGGFRIIWTDG